MALLFAAAAMAQNVQYNFDQDADFSKYKTYRWQKHPQSLELDQFTRNQLGAAFNAELAKKGLTVAQSGDTDLVLVYQIATRTERQITSFDTGWGYGPGWRRGWSGGGMTTSTTDTIQIGSLTLDMYDAAQKRLVWRGVVSKALDERAKPEKRKKNMAKAAEKLLKNYPPKKKK